MLIPANATSADLNFYLWRGAWAQNASDLFEVTVDGTQVFAVDGNGMAAYDSGYTLVTVDLLSYADGAMHDIVFHNNFLAGDGTTNLNLDDISLDLNVQLPTTTSITGNTPNPSELGDSVTVNFSVSGELPPVAPPAGAVAAVSSSAPSGNVTVTASSGENCVGSLDINGDGACDITFNTPGDRTLTASYAGDPDYAVSTSAGVTQAVNAAAASGNRPVPLFGSWALGLLLTALGFVGGRRLKRKA